MKMSADIKVRYAQSLERSESFLKAKKNTARSTSITSSRELCLLRNQAECPICAINFRGKNHNTEHIHPRALGGLNNDENKIQMCTACNNARNLTMQSMLGTPPYYKNYLKIKQDVDEFILWSEVTVDDGLLAGTAFPRVQAIFSEARFANSVPPIPMRAYGRFSTWDKDDPPNLKFNKFPVTSTNIKSKPSLSKPGIMTRFFDWIFDYQPPKTEASKNSRHNGTTENNSIRIADNDLLKQTDLNPNYSVNENSAPNNKINQSLRGDGPRIITHLNSANKGLRYPKDPRHFALSWEWFIENAMNFTTFEECLEGLIGADIIPKSRAHKFLKTMLRAYSSDVIFESLSEQDLQKDKNTILSEILALLKSNLANEKYMDYISEREIFMLEIEKYFNNVIKEFGKNHQHEKFQLLHWIKLNWEDEESYPSLRDEILAHEKANNRERTLKDILKEDFDIPKSWTIAKKSLYWSELKLSSEEE